MKWCSMCRPREVLQQRNDGEMCTVSKLKTIPKKTLGKNCDKIYSVKESNLAITPKYRGRPNKKNTKIVNSTPKKLICTSSSFFHGVTTETVGCYTTPMQVNSTFGLNSITMSAIQWRCSSLISIIKVIVVDQVRLES